MPAKSIKSSRSVLIRARRQQLAAAKKQTYVKAYNRASGNAGWHFLTGDDANIKRVTDAVGFRYKWDEKTNQFAHASGIFVLTPEGKLARYFYGIEYPLIAMCGSGWWKLRRTTSARPSIR